MFLKTASLCSDNCSPSPGQLFVIVRNGCSASFGITVRYHRNTHFLQLILVNVLDFLWLDAKIIKWLLLGAVVETYHKSGQIDTKCYPLMVDALITSLQPGTFLFQKTAIDAMSKRFRLPGHFSLTHDGIYRLKYASLNQDWNILKHRSH
jgi:hypothetical protein